MAAEDLSSKQPGEWFSSAPTAATSGDVRKVILPAWCEGVRVFATGGQCVVYDDQQSLTDGATIASEEGITIPSGQALPIYRGVKRQGTWAIYVESGGAAFGIDPIHRMA